MTNTIYKLHKEPEKIEDVIPHIDTNRIVVVCFPDYKRHIKTSN